MVMDLKLKVMRAAVSAAMLVALVEGLGRGEVVVSNSPRGAGRKW